MERIISHLLLLPPVLGLFYLLRYFTLRILFQLRKPDLSRFIRSLKSVITDTSDPQCDPDGSNDPGMRSNMYTKL